ncbi:MAG: DUF1554 domain-containing protein [Deltaproteobacteria bacterium]|nr:DUF1554 domain-containing protein [Deltaproteobacteria bacterium]
MKIVVLVVLLVTASPAAAATSAAQLCQAAKNLLAGRLANCRQKAASTLARTGNGARYAASLAKCDGRFTAKWALVETGAAGNCPTNDDVSLIDSLVTTNANEIAALLSGSTTQVCGDGIRQYGEECEIGTLYGASCTFGGTLACVPGTCTLDKGGCRTWARTFVTSTLQLGTFGGLAGGDAICQARADAATLGGTWRAWLSTSTLDTRDRIVGAQYRLVDGTTVIASSLNDLLDGTLTNNIDHDENGALAIPNVWTGTHGDGTATASTCSDWTTGTATGTYGANDLPTASMVWSEQSTSLCGSNSLRLYCIETLPYKRVFVTSTGYNGNVGGLAGADQKCRDRAVAAGLGGTWRAWLSTSSVNAKDRVLDTTYRTLDGRLVATNKADLTDGAITSLIDVDEFGAPAGVYVWTGTRTNGTVYSSNTCLDWTSASEDTFGGFGLSDYGVTSWTHWNIDIDPVAECAISTLGLYCFEQ